MKARLRRLRYTKAEKTLLKVNPGYYTIQLMSSPSLTMIRQFIAANELEGQVAYYKAKIRNQRRYALVYGRFHDQQDALVTIRDLPIGMQRWSPFVKRFNILQTEIRGRA